MTKCPKCGTETESKFCPNCGANLQESLSEEPAVIVEESNDIPADEKTEKKKDKKKKSKTTICKHCGAEIATSAKACPKCGGKNKKPIYKRVWFWILIAILMLWLVSSLVSCSAENPFQIDKVYYSESGAWSYLDSEAAEERYLTTNPEEKEENLDDHDDVSLFFFASLNSISKDDVKIPICTLEKALPGLVLNASLRIGDEEYDNIYDWNDLDDRYGTPRLTKFWEQYKSGSNIDTNYTLYAGSDDKVQVVFLFRVPYKEYRTAVENSEDLTVVWGDSDIEYTAKYNAKDIVKKKGVYSISKEV